LAEYGSLNGNVFWKYNNYVGNKPDASSEIYIYSLEDSLLHYEATADVRGDFRIDSIPTGQYLVIVKSKNTTSDGYTLYLGLDNNSMYLDKLFGTNMKKTFTAAVHDTISKLMDSSMLSLQSASSASASEALNKSYAYDKKRRVMSDKILDSLPIEIKRITGISGTGSNSVKFREVKIAKGRAENMVADFGTTYM
jgi:hypothetical protein